MLSLSASGHGPSERNVAANRVLQNGKSFGTGGMEKKITGESKDSNRLKFSASFETHFAPKGPGLVDLNDSGGIL